MKIKYNISRIFAIRFKKFVWFLGNHAFSAILFLIFLNLICGCFIFYKYVFLTQNKQPAPAENIIKFNEKAYQNVIGELQIED